MASAVGAYFHLLWNIGGLLTTLGCMGCIIWLLSAPVYEEVFLVLPLLVFFSFCFIIIIIFLILVGFLYGTEEKIWSSYDIFFLPRSFSGSSDRICYWVRSEVYFYFFLMDFGANFNELCIIHLFLLWLILTDPLNTPYQLIYKWIGEILMNFLLWD